MQAMSFTVHTFELRLKYSLSFVLQVSHSCSPGGPARSACYVRFLEFAPSLCFVKKDVVAWNKI